MQMRGESAPRVGIIGHRHHAYRRRGGQQAVDMRKQRTAPRGFPTDSLAQLLYVQRDQDQAGPAGEMPP